MAIRVLIVDDHTVVRVGLRSLFAARRDVAAIDEASSGAEAVQAAARSCPDLVLMNVRMPGLSGIDATRRILSLATNGNAPRVIMFSSTAEPVLVSASVRAGARGYLTKDCGLAELGAAVDGVLAGGKYFSSAIADRDRLARESRSTGRGRKAANQSALSPREREVLTLLAQGHTSKEIGEELAISHKTVETHRAQIMAKLNLRSVAELTRFAIREGLVGLGDPG